MQYSMGREKKVYQLFGHSSEGPEGPAGTTSKSSVYFRGPLVCVSRLGAVPLLTFGLQPEHGAVLMSAPHS
jgi:hypothetical protein